MFFYCKYINIITVCRLGTAFFFFQNNIRWRRLSDLVYTLGDWLRETEMPSRFKKQLREAIDKVIWEVQRWNEKHASLFGDEKPGGLFGIKTQRAHRSEHLRMFYHCLVWKAHMFEIDDYATAQNLIKKECYNWPQMQFQFACAYAMLDLLKDKYRFDAIRLKAFSKKLSDHCLYSFWITILSSPVAWERMFSSDALAPKQMLSLVFQFAILNGFFELMNFIWERVTNAQREYIGILQWGKICFRAKHGSVLRFLCDQLCEINSNTLVRITWNAFYDALHKSIQVESFLMKGANNKRKRDDNLRKMEFLLEHCCPRLRKSMLSLENFKIITDAYAYNQNDAFSLLLDYLSEDQLQLARQSTNRIYSEKKEEFAVHWRKMVFERQQTI
ncbi:unnamed protein product [Enterobius vermicularis]|uniref:Uncharacterized protein n=1 Tax=Enterobius vermicularis TaxID=51028 RepID=A0A3P6IJ26_ENTVE|nr:unnamed protein product [Enterobius vermicularis]